MKMLGHVVRILLSAGLLYGMYSEVGPFTFAFAVLLVVNHEARILLKWLERFNADMRQLLDYYEAHKG